MRTRDTLWFSRYSMEFRMWRTNAPFLVHWLIWAFFGWWYFGTTFAACLSLIMRDTYGHAGGPFAIVFVLSASVIFRLEIAHIIFWLCGTYWYSRFWITTRLSSSASAARFLQNPVSCSCRTQCPALTEQPQVRMLQCSARQLHDRVSAMPVRPRTEVGIACCNPSLLHPWWEAKYLFPASTMIQYCTWTSRQRLPLHVVRKVQHQYAHDCRTNVRKRNPRVQWGFQCSKTFQYPYPTGNGWKLEHQYRQKCCWKRPCRLGYMLRLVVVETRPVATGLIDKDEHRPSMCEWDRKPQAKRILCYASTLKHLPSATLPPDWICSFDTTADEVDKQCRAPSRTSRRRAYSAEIQIDG